MKTPVFYVLKSARLTAKFVNFVPWCLGGSKKLRAVDEDRPVKIGVVLIY
jgi:hypothetical protein